MFRQYTPESTWLRGWSQETVQNVHHIVRNVCLATLLSFVSGGFHRAWQLVARLLSFEQHLLQRLSEKQFGDSGSNFCHETLLGVHLAQIVISQTHVPDVNTLSVEKAGNFLRMQVVKGHVVQFEDEGR